MRGGVGPDKGDLVATVDHPVVQKAGVDGGAGLDGDGGEVCEDAEAHGGGLWQVEQECPRGGVKTIQFRGHLWSRLAPLYGSMALGTA